MLTVVRHGGRLVRPRTSAEIAAARKSCKELIEVLRKASAIINEVRDFNFR